MSTTICVLVYNKGFEYPINLDLKTGNACGLCNQLTQIVNLLCRGQRNFYVDLFSTDFGEGTMVPVTTILDLERMNELHGLNLKDVIHLTAEEYHSGCSVIHWGPPFTEYWGNTGLFIDSARKLEMSRLFREMGSDLVSKKGLTGKEVNLIHLRIDWDFKNHCRYDIDPYYDSIVSKYEEEINRHCDPSIPLCLLLDSYEHELVGRLKEKYDVVFITKEERNTYLPGKIQGKRDIYAFCDFAFAKNLKVNNLFILENSRETSSFSVMLKSCLDYNRVIAI